MRVLHVYGCEPQYQEDLIVYMEKFGDLFDIDLTSQNKGRKEIFHYKNVDDAKKVILIYENQKYISFRKILRPGKSNSLLQSNSIYHSFQALAEAPKFDKCPITVEWAPVSLGTAEIVPDVKRDPTEQMTPAALLASLGDDEVRFVLNYEVF